jgi:hypothetical protein
MKKKTLLILIILVNITLRSIAQKLEENKKDDFTNDSIKHTSWETFCSSFTINSHFRMSQINNQKTFDVKIMLDKMFFIDEDAKMMLKLASGEVVTLQNLKAAKTCSGCGAIGFRGSEAPGIEVVYPMTKEDVEKLKANKVVKVRIYTSLGYLEEDVKDKNSEKIGKSLTLLD